MSQNPFEEIVYIGGRPFGAHPTLAREMEVLRSKVALLTHANEVAAERINELKGLIKFGASKEIPSLGKGVRWSAAVKEDIIIAIHKGALSRDEAMALYGFSDDELASMEMRFKKYGRRGLNATKLQIVGPTGVATVFR